MNSNHDGTEPERKVHFSNKRSIKLNCRARSHNRTSKVQVEICLYQPEHTYATSGALCKPLVMTK